MTGRAQKACVWLLRFEIAKVALTPHGVSEHDRAGPKWRKPRTERCFRKARPGSGSAPDCYRHRSVFPMDEFSRQIQGIPEQALVRVHRSLVGGGERLGLEGGRSPR